MGVIQIVPEDNLNLCDFFFLKGHFEKGEHDLVQ